MPQMFPRPRVPSLPATAALALALALGWAGAPRLAAQTPAPPVGAQAAPAPGAVLPTPAEAGPKPALKVEGGEVFNLGAVWPGEALQHTFVLTNAGDAPLKILRVQPG